MIFVSTKHSIEKKYNIKNVNHNELGGLIIEGCGELLRAIYISLDEYTVKEIESIMDDIGYCPSSSISPLRIMQNNEKKITLHFIGGTDHKQYNDINEIKSSVNELTSWINHYKE